MKWIPPKEVARRRIIEEFAVDGGKGKIVACGRTFELKFDDVVDLAQAVEMIMLNLTGKLLRAKFRPEIKSRKLLAFTKMLGGDYSLYTGNDAPLPASTTCEVTGHQVKTHYLLVEIEGNRWEQWFGRLDELAKCLYIIVREAQGDPYEAQPHVFVGAKGPLASVQFSQVQDPTTFTAGPHGVILAEPKPTSTLVKGEGNA
jgi:hypothetical protein